MRAEYKSVDLCKGMRGQYYDAYQASYNTFLLKPEVSKAFPTEKAVNKALLFLIKVAQELVGLTKGLSGRS